MDFLLVPFRVAYKIYFSFCFGFFLILFFPVFRYYLSEPKRYPKAFIGMRCFAWLLNILALIKIKTEGKNNIPEKGSYIICPNHSSFIDIPCLYIIFKKYFVFTGKKEIENWPLFHIFYTSGMNILVDRKFGNGSFKAIKRMAEVIDKGFPLVIFPEGTISKQAPRLTSFKPGAFSIAIQKQVPVLPVTFLTNWKLLQRGSFFGGKARPGLSRVIIHEPISTLNLKKTDATLLENMVREKIQEPLKKYI